MGWYWGSSRSVYGRWAACTGAIAAGVLVSAVTAQTAPTLEGSSTVPTDRSAFTLFHPTPRDQMREMSTDRPDTTESPFTVDAGHVQLEMSFIEYSRDRWNDAGATVEGIAVAPLLLRVGVLDSVDVELGVNPWGREREKDRATGDQSTAEGFGDTIVRVKWNLCGNDGEGVAFGLLPFIKLPTADDDVGNGKVEGGLILPLAFNLPWDFEVGTMAEFDVLRSAADERYVVDFVHSVTVGHAVVEPVSAYLEYAGFANLNHDEDYRGFVDTGLLWTVTKDVQLDAGVRIGVTKAAEDFAVFAGISLRY